MSCICANLARVILREPVQTIKCTNYYLVTSQFRLGKQNESCRFINKQSVRSLVAFKRKSLFIKTTKLSAKYKMEWPKITLFGDSITRRSMDPDNGCWGSYIAYQVGSFFDVDARGFEGYNTTWALELMPQLFPKSYLDKVEIFVIFYGHNDSWQGSTPLGIPVEKYEANLHSIIKYLSENGLEKKKIVMITPTWLHEESFIEHMKESNMPIITKSEEHAKSYSDAALRVAKEHGVDILDFYDISLKYKPLENLFCDGVHFSREGARLLYTNLMPMIEKKLETNFKKPLADLWQVTPLDLRPEMKEYQPAVQAYRAKLAEEGSASGKKHS